MGTHGRKEHTDDSDANELSSVLANATRLALGAVVGVGAVVRDADADKEERDEDPSTLSKDVLSLIDVLAKTSVDGDPGSDDPAMIVDSSAPFVEVTDDSVD